MPRYLRVLKDNKKRNLFNEKLFRATRLSVHLGHIGRKEQIRLFKSYCQLTGAGKSVYSQFALSRHSLRKHANFGLVSGVKPSSW